MDEVGIYEFSYVAVLKVTANPEGEVWRNGEAGILEIEILAATPDQVVDSFSPTVAREGELIKVSGAGLSGAIQVLTGAT